MDINKRIAIVLSILLGLFGILYGSAYLFFNILYKIDEESGAFDSNIVEIINDQKKIAIYKKSAYDADGEHYKSVDLVDLDFKDGDFTVHKILLKGIILYYYPEIDSTAYLILRDSTRWKVDTNGQISEHADKSYPNTFEFRDIYYEHSDESWLDPPIYPTSFFEKDGIRFQATYNRYTENYYLEFCETDGDERSGSFRGVKLFKVEYPYIYVIKKMGKYLTT